MAILIVFLTGKVTQRAWDRQMSFTTRKECYVKVWNELTGLKSFCGTILAELSVTGGGYASGDQTDSQIHKLADSIELLSTSIESSRIFIPMRVFETLCKVKSGFVAMYAASTAGQDANTGSPNLDSSFRNLDNLLEGFIRMAQKDLRIDPDLAMK